MQVQTGDIQMKLNDLFENDSSSNSNLRSTNHRTGDVEEPRKKKEVDLVPLDVQRLKLLRAKAAKIYKFGVRGDFRSLYSKEMSSAPSGTAFIVHHAKNPKINLLDLSYVKIGKTWISLKDLSAVPAVEIFRRGRKLSDQYGWAAGPL